VGTGFDYVEVHAEQQLAQTMRDAVFPLQQEIAALKQENAALKAALAVSPAASSFPPDKRARR
jgi:hypothetical protein